MSLKLVNLQTEIITGEMLAEMGDIGPSELLEGEIVRMSPTGYEHGNIEMKIGAKLYIFVTTHDLGKVQAGEVGIYTRRDPDSIRAADVLYISHKRYKQRKSQSYLDVAPELIVEILSPDDRWSIVTQKLREYFAIGVNLVWVIDVNGRRVYAYRSLTDVREFAEKDELPGDDILPGFSIQIDEIFED